jgi:hypothetical protein
VQACEKQKVTVPLLCFERWMSRSKLLEQKAVEPHSEPLLPALGQRDKGLIKVASSSTTLH